jgi:hypothetical protein
MILIGSESQAARTAREIQRGSLQGAMRSDDEAMVRCALEHCSLFGLTTGLRILELGHEQSALGAAFKDVLDDVDHCLLAVQPEGAALAALAKGGQDVDVIVLNHLNQVCTEALRPTLLATLAARLLPNGIIIVSDFVDTAGIGSDPLHAAAHRLCGADSAIVDAERLSDAPDTVGEGCVHIVVVLRPGDSAPPPVFSADDYTFSLSKPVSCVLCKEICRVTPARQGAFQASVISTCLKTSMFLTCFPQCRTFARMEERKLKL